MSKIKNLFFILKEKHISQKQFAIDLGLSAGNVTDWKNGRSAPSIDKLPIIADYLNVSLDYLFGRSEPSAPTAPELDPESREVLEMYRELTTEQQSLIKATMQSWLAVNDKAAIEKKKDV